MPTEKPRPERPADLREKAREDLLYLARAERSMGNDLLASRVEEAVESLDAFRSFAIHQAEQIADLKERLDRKMARLRQAGEVIAGLEDEHTSADTREDVVRRLAEAILCDPELLHGHPDTEDTTGVAYEAAERIAAELGLGVSEAVVEQDRAS